jgi:hypothetical protein
MSHPLFAVSRFKNRNGVYSFRVEGSLNGVRIRQNFKTQEGAAAEKGTLELKAMQAPPPGCNLPSRPSKRIMAGRLKGSVTAIPTANPICRPL